MSGLSEPFLPCLTQTSTSQNYLWDLDALLADLQGQNYSHNNIKILLFSHGLTIELALNKILSLLQTNNS